MRHEGLPERLREVRQARGQSQTDVSLKAGLDRSACTYIEAKRAGNVLVGTVDRLARVLGVDPGWLAFGDGPGRAERAASAVPGPTPGPLPVTKKPLALPPARPTPQHSFDHRMVYYARCSPPPLQERFDPVLVALGTSLGPAGQKQVAQCLLGLLKAYEPARLSERVEEFRAAVQAHVPEEGQQPLTEILGELRCVDPHRRVPMVLVLIVDAGLPVTPAELNLPEMQFYPEAVRQTCDEVIKLLQRGKNYIHGDPRERRRILRLLAKWESTRRGIDSPGNRLAGE